MNESTLFRVEWNARYVPLDVSGVAAQGATAARLARRLLSEDDSSLSGLKGVAGVRLLVVMGQAEKLPWVDGVVYLGRDPQAPSLLVLTNLSPALPIALVERALITRAYAPCALLFHPPSVVPLTAARSIDRAVLEAWLRENK